MRNQTESESTQARVNKEPWLAVNLSKLLPGIDILFSVITAIIVTIVIRFVPREKIVGKATSRFYPFDRLGFLEE
jgi:hypothetical protein